jgi:hypothetical protein
MRARSLTAASLLLLTCAATVADTPAEYKQFERMAVNLFQAYNRDDATGVFVDYVTTFKKLDNKQLFDALFKPHKEKCGNYKKHTFQKQGSVQTDDLVLMVLDTEFVKKKAKVSVNFGKEGGKWKIQQVTFDPK